MSGDQDRLARLALSLSCEPGDLAVLGMVARSGAVVAEDLLRRDVDLAGDRTPVASRLAAADAGRVLELGLRSGFRWVVPGDPEWPEQLDDLDHVEPLQERGLRPLGLWVHGPLRLDQIAPGVAVVGSRSCTGYGLEVARELSATIAGAGARVVSGAALGIDQAAHRGALVAGGQTVAVLACGVDRAYPKAHQPLLDHLAEEGGAVVAEVAPGWAPYKQRFLARNRVIAALSLGTVVVEAAIRSGALSTANWTSRLSRPLLGVPGPVTSAPSAGVHHQIRIGAALLVTDGEQVLEAVGRSGEHLLAEPRAPERPTDRLNPRHQQVLEVLPARRAMTSEAVVRRTGLALLEVERAMTALRRRGLVVEEPDGWRLTGDGAPRSGPRSRVPTVGR